MKKWITGFWIMVFIIVTVFSVFTSSMAASSDDSFTRSGTQEDSSFNRSGGQKETESPANGGFTRSDGQEETIRVPETTAEATPETTPEEPVTAEPVSETVPEITTGNLLTNPNPGEYMTGWSVYTQNQDIEGNYGPEKASMIYQTVPLYLYSPGQTIRLRGTVNVAPEDPEQRMISISLWFYNAEDNRIAIEDILEYGTEPADRELTAEIPEGAEYVKVMIAIIKKGEQNIFHASNVSLEVLGGAGSEETGSVQNTQTAQSLADNAGLYTPYAMEANGYLIEMDSIDTDADVSARIQLNADGTGDWDGVSILWRADDGVFILDGEVYGTIGDGVMIWNNLESPESADGRVYFLREGTDKSVLGAVTQTQALASEARPYYDLGISYLYGTGDGGYDPGLADENLLTAYNSGIPDAGYYRGQIILNSADDDRFTRVYAVYEEAAQAGSSLALIGLGDLYLNGYSVEMDQVKALELYQSALDQGCTEAGVGLGNMYQNGYGTEADGSKALELYTKAADSEEYAFRNEARCNIGKLYLYGAPGIDRDYGQAMLWFTRTANEDYGPAYDCIGLLYENGAGVEQSYADAQTWYQRGAAHGSAEALHDLGMLYSNNEELGNDPVTAQSYWTQAAEMGHAGSMYLVGLGYEFGAGEQPDYASARYWYEKALAAAGTDENVKVNATEGLARLDQYNTQNSQTQDTGYDTSADYGYDYNQYETEPWEDPYFIGYSQDGTPQYSYDTYQYETEPWEDPNFIGYSQDGTPQYSY